MANVEIHVKALTLEDLRRWFTARFTAHYREGVDGNFHIYKAPYDGVIVTVIVQLNMEGTLYTSVWFNAEETPWDSCLDCARDAFSFFGKAVLCDPGVDLASDYEIMYISADGNRIVPLTYIKEGRV
ncbi:MAG: hypothetical protein JW874_07445 [Spirochaetales bacterium]|nr:hypothetical protein [Spirochaetales bacterium]